MSKETRYKVRDILERAFNYIEADVAIIVNGLKDLRSFQFCHNGCRRVRVSFDCTLEDGLHVRFKLFNKEQVESLDNFVEHHGFGKRSVAGKILKGVHRLIFQRWIKSEIVR